jgi:hypothetical protein
MTRVMIKHKGRKMAQRGSGSYDITPPKICRLAATTAAQLVAAFGGPEAFWCFMRVSRSSIAVGMMGMATPWPTSILTRYGIVHQHENFASQPCR